MANKAITPDDGLRVRVDGRTTIHAEIPGGNYFTYCGLALLFRGFVVADFTEVTCKTCAALI